MTADPEYVHVRTDIAELRGLIAGQMQSLQSGQQRHEERLNRVDVEFDQVHQRVNGISQQVSSHTTAIKNLEAQPGASRANWAMWISGAGVIIALASEITWA